MPVITITAIVSHLKSIGAPCFLPIAFASSWKSYACWPRRFPPVARALGKNLRRTETIEFTLYIIKAQRVGYWGMDMGL